MRGTSRVAFVLAAGVCVAVLLFVPRIPQPAGYHRLADMRTFFGIPNFLDVVSNVPFAVVGACGLWVVFRRRRAPPPWDRAPYAVLFAGVLLTALGSAWYHLAPDNARLVWDRLPMTIAFTAVLAAVAGERLDPRCGRRLLWPLVLAGLASVGWWIWTEGRGVGDLRPYGLVQFGSLTAVVALLAFAKSPYPGSGYLWAAIAFYAAAKLLELGDRTLFSAAGIVSGHTLKHLAAACGGACLVLMLRSRARKRACHTAL